ncbi:MAG: hypothetical protein Q4C85_07150 [Actinomyces sp.]|uniref:hypothetical protein n=1 Tax=Actinomyces sp. TaxID=29317 RepID=UPI0026DAC415|nr:hypothetical protein [Actinomyces sp.]MDO4243519.1 hypothetical protein [Actinomyces sp.]
MSLLPVCLYETDGDSAAPAAILLPPDLDGEDLELVLANLPGYLDLDPWPAGQGWEVHRGWWAWTADLAPSDPAQPGAFEAIRLNRATG